MDSLIDYIGNAGTSSCNNFNVIGASSSSLVLDPLYVVQHIQIIRFNFLRGYTKWLRIFPMFDSIEKDLRNSFVVY